MNPIDLNLENPISPASPHRHRMLVVDSNAATASSLKDIFTLEGYETRSALSGEEGMKIVQHWRPDLVISDFIMCHMNGLEMVKQVVERYPACSMILLSTSTRQDIWDEALRLGFDFYYKPVYPSILIERAAFLLSHRQSHLNKQGHPIL